MPQHTKIQTGSVRELLAGAREDASYHVILSILRITSRGHDVKTAVAKYLDSRVNTTISLLIDHLRRAANKAGYSISATVHKPDDVTMRIRKLSQ